MFKAIKEFFGFFDKTETSTKVNSGTVTVTVKAPEVSNTTASSKPANKAAPKKRGPAKKPKKSATK